MLRVTVIALSLCCASGSAIAQQMHKCKNAQGITAFQQMPCSPAGGGETVEMRQIKTTGAGGNQNSARLQYLAKKAGRDRRLLEIDREIRELEDQTVGYRNSMDSELARLRNKKRFANNNLAGATWEQSISEEMIAVATKYDSAIRDAQENIDQLRTEKKQLQKESQKERERQNER